MRIFIVWLMLAGLPAALASGLPAGLVLGEGAEVSRNGLPAAPAAAGELLYAGDVVTGRKAVRVLSCMDRMMGTLPAGVAATVEARGVMAERWETRTPVKSCYLPAVTKGPVGGPKHLGAMMVRSLGEAETGTRADRMAGLPEAERAALERELRALAGEAPEMMVMRGVMYQRARLFVDARGEYESALKAWPRAVWLKTLMIAAEDAAQRAR
jgi:hypothetical protein